MLSGREVEILNIICAAEKPMTSADIVNEKRELTQSTVIACLRNLTKAGAVRIDGVTHSGKALSRTYVAGESAKAAVMEIYRELFRNTRNIITVQDLENLDSTSDS